jgi:hypothetical protein
MRDALDVEAVVLPCRAEDVRVARRVQLARVDAEEAEERIGEGLPYVEAEDGDAGTREDSPQLAERAPELTEMLENARFSGAVMPE